MSYRDYVENDEATFFWAIDSRFNISKFRKKFDEIAKTRKGVLMAHDVLEILNASVIR